MWANKKLPIFQIFFILVFIGKFHGISANCSSKYVAINTWGTGQTAKFDFTIPQTSTSAGWTVKVTFDKAPKKFVVYNGKNVQCTRTVCTFTNR